MIIKKYGSKFEAFATIVGTVVGLGIFTIPYAARNVGVTPTITLIIFVAIAMLVLSVLFAEIIIFDKREECIIAYARRYLGGWAGKIETCSILFGYTGSILAYVLAVTVFVQAVIPGEVSFFWPIILVYSAISCIVVLKGTKNLGRIEFVLAAAMCIIFLLVFGSSIPFWGGVKESWGNMIIPYGVVWFALTGESAIPIAVRLLGGEKKKIFPIIFLAYIFIALITVLFFVGALKTGGAIIGPDPFIAMGQKMGEWVKYTGTVLGLLAVVTSHWVLATYLKNILSSDIKIGRLYSWALVIFIPMVLILLGASNFVHIVGLVGVVAGTTDALIILTIYKKIFSRKNTVPRVLPFKLPGAVVWAFFLLLVGAAVSSILSG
ncbi:MAG: aromatic amino acid transport family protein [Candidatus Moraniibacteriota bacterium]